MAAAHEDFLHHLASWLINLDHPKYSVQLRLI